MSSKGRRGPYGRFRVDENLPRGDKMRRFDVGGAIMSVYASQKYVTIMTEIHQEICQ